MVVKYETELEVTQALIRGEIDGIQALSYYEEAKKYQKWLKEENRKNFRFFKRATPKPDYGRIVFRPGYTTKKEDE